jgi:hypothetical protein
MKGWKTVFFNAILALIGVLEAADWADIVPEGWTGAALIVVGVVGTWLRKITTTPLGES